MSLSSKALLIACASLSLHAMEQKSSTITLDSQHYNQVNDLYKKAYSTLGYYNPKEDLTITALYDIITKTNDLKKVNVEEKQIGNFAYNQEASITNKVFSTYGKPPYNGPLYVSVLFEKIARYNAQLVKNQFTSPTIEQFNRHINNQKIKNAIHTAADFKLFINLNALNGEKNILSSIPITVATEEFEALVNDIAKLQQATPEDIKIIADILYCSLIQKDQ
jgi:hypothetical protein